MVECRSMYRTNGYATDFTTWFNYKVNIFHHKINIFQ